MRVCVGFLYRPLPRETLVGRKEHRGGSGRFGPSSAPAASGKCLCARNELITKSSSRQMPTRTPLSALFQSPCPNFSEGEMMIALII